MKRIFTLMLCLCVVFCALAGCGHKKEGDTTTTTDPSPKDQQYALSNLLATDYLQYVTLCQYKNIEIKSDSEEYQALRKQYTEYYLGNGGYVKEYENRPVEDGDTVNIDYVGYCDGEAFEGGDTKGAGVNLTIGSNSYIDDFEEQLIGAKPGDTVNVNVTFPENYGKENLNGKDALFVVKVNYIASAPIYPDLAKNPDILKDCFKCDTMDEFEEKIKTEIGSRLVLSMVMEGSVIKSYPQEKLDDTRKQFEDLYSSYAQMYGITVEELFELQGQNFDEVIKSAVKEEIVYLAIIQSEGIDYTDEEYEQLCEDYAKENSYATLDALLESVISNYSSKAHAKYDLSLFLLQEMAKEIITDSVNIILVK